MMSDKVCKLVDEITEKSIFEDEALESIWQWREEGDCVAFKDILDDFT